MGKGYYKFGIARAKAKLVLATLLMLLWGSLPSTACICADGTFKVFCSGLCSGLCSGTRCCYGKSPGSCTSCAGHANAGTKHNVSIGCAETDASQRLNKPCGCHRVAKDQATMLSRVGADEDNTQSSAFCSTSFLTFSNANLSPLSSTGNENRDRPPDDIVILFRHLII